MQYHHPGTDKTGHPTSECGSRGCLTNDLRNAAYSRGYVDGLEAAANTLDAEIKWNANDVPVNAFLGTFAQILRDQAAKVRDSGQ